MKNIQIFKDLRLEALKLDTDLHFEALHTILKFSENLSFTVPLDPWRSLAKYFFNRGPL